MPSITSSKRGSHKTPNFSKKRIPQNTKKANLKTKTILKDDTIYDFDEDELWSDYDGGKLDEIAKANGVSVMEENLLGSLTEGDLRTGKGFDPEGYSERELEIVRAVADGLSNKEIAGRLFISEGTVKNYITSILAKEGLSHRTALAVYYLTGKKQS